MNRKKVALVLSSGGARGIAHIGVIEELERRHFEINSIAGTSMGALVGGMYASGNFDKFKEWIFACDKRKMFSLADITLSNNGLIKGDKLLKDLKKIMPNVNIEDCNIPFVAVATDLKSEMEIDFVKGDLYDAMRASISIPAFFKPLKLNNMLLVDGGVVNPLPLNRVKRCEDDILMAVNVSAQAVLNTPQIKSNVAKNSFKELCDKYLPNINKSESNYLSLLSKLSRIVIEENARQACSFYQPDITVNIPINMYHSFDFFKSAEIIEVGRLEAAKALDRWDIKAS